MLRAFLAATVLVLAAHVALAHSAPRSAGDASLRLMAVHPLKVSGAGFAPGEHIRVVAHTAGAGDTARADAGPRGRFVVTFRGMTVGRCAGLNVVATGEHGERARLLRRAPECAQE